MQHDDGGMRARALRSKQITHQLGLAVGAGKVHCFRLGTCIGDDKASDTGTCNRRCSDRIEKSPPPHVAASDHREVLEWVSASPRGSLGRPDALTGLSPVRTL